MTNVTISCLTIYPVKSMRGISLQSAELDAMGLRWDRRWMLVDENNRFLTGRQCPKLLTIQPELTPEGELTLRFPDGAGISVALDSAQPSITVTVWNDEVNAQQVNQDINDYLSNFLSKNCRLVFIDEEEMRQVDLDYAQSGDRTGFADGFPLLLISEASLEDLNSRLQIPIPMTRFRPNIVITGCDAFEEDQWQSFTVNGINFSIVKPCSRCVMTTIDQEVGEKTGMEPLQTLMKYRRQGNKVMFGQNVIHQSMGRIRLGDEIDVND